MESRSRINTDGTSDSTGAQDNTLTLLPSRQTYLKDFKYPDGIRTAVSFTVDFDAMLARKLMRDPLLAVTKGEFGGRVGIWRLIDLFKKHGIKATIFTPGRIGELYPGALKKAASDGHELADHMWEHHVPEDIELERDHLQKTKKALEKITGTKPVGSRSTSTLRLLKEEGYIYVSMFGADELPYYLYDAEGNHLLNIPFSFTLDDAMFFSYRIFGSPIAGPRLEAPDTLFEVWLAIFKQFYKTGKYMNICLHPFVSGRSLRIAMLDRLIAEMKKLPGVWFPTCEEMARYCIGGYPAEV